MKEEQLKVYKSIFNVVKTLASLAFLSIFVGLASWLFWPQGWKVAVLGLIVCIWLELVAAGAKKAIDKE